MIVPPGRALPLAEPMVPPHRSADQPRRRISVGLDQDRYVRLRALAAETGLTGEQVVIVALDRLMTGR
jgi:hypothetical protein